MRIIIFQANAQIRLEERVSSFLLHFWALGLFFCRGFVQRWSTHHHMGNGEEIFGLSSHQIFRSLSFGWVRVPFQVSRERKLGRFLYNIFIIFRGRLPFDRHPKQEDVATRNLMVDVWANFLKFRRPTSSWKRVTPESLNYGRISNGEVNFAKDEEFEKRMQMWRNLILKEEKLYLR